MTQKPQTCTHCNCNCHSPRRRRFLLSAAVGVGMASLAQAARAFSFGFADFNPKPVDIDLAAIPVGETKTIMWGGKPVAIHHRSAAEIAAAQQILPDHPQIQPQTDAERVQRPEWLVVFASCTHLACIPRPSDIEGVWLACPCHGALFDTAGRVVRGPAERNLDIPPYHFVTDTTVRIGEEKPHAKS